jgi:hypothetical protein
VSVEVENHNSGQWLRVVHVERGYTFHVRGPRFPPGWYVMRTCPCHAGQPVTRAYDSEERAMQAAAAMVTASMILDT